MFRHANIEYCIKHTNVDLLIRLLILGRRHYSAAGAKSFNFGRFKFKKCDDYYSLYVQDFVLDGVQEMNDASRNGNIPAD
jgi:hypothetical protein